MEEKENLGPTESDVEDGKTKVKHHKADSNEAGEKGPKIKKGKVDSLTIYEVTEAELEAIEIGSPNSNLLNFGIALVTTAISFLITLLTVDVTDIKLFIVFTLVTIVGFAGGGILLYMWYKTKNNVELIFKKIRDRIKE